MSTATAEGPWLLDVPPVEPEDDHGTPTWWKREFAKFQDTARNRGGMVTQAQASLILGVSRARVGQLVNVGKLECIDIFDGKYIPGDSLLAFSFAEKNKGGRPSKLKLMAAGWDRS